MKRRKFLLALATSASALAGKAAAQQPSAQPPRSFSPSLKNPGIDRADSRYLGDERKRYGMLIDLRRCIGCKACEAACICENNVPQEQFRCFVQDYELSRGGRVNKAFLPVLCNHCDNPPCVSVCPTGATFKRRDGLVLVDADICWGCSFCVQACPYDKRFINARTKVVDKCTFCAHKLDRGELPACVATCVGRARIIGDLNDPASEISQLLAEHNTSVLSEHFGTRPRVYYIGLDGELNTLRADHKMLHDLSRKLDGALEHEWRMK